MSYHSSCNLYVPLFREMVCKYILHCHQIPLHVITNLLLPLLLFCSIPTELLTLGRLSFTKPHVKVQIGTLKNCGWWNCKMADYLYSITVQTHSFQNNMADKTVWRINKYLLYVSNLFHFVTDLADLVLALVPISIL